MYFYLLILVSVNLLKVLGDCSPKSSGCLRVSHGYLARTYFLPPYNSLHRYSIRDDPSLEWNLFYPDEDGGRSNNTVFELQQLCMLSATVELLDSTHLLQMITINQECFQIIHANDNFPYFCSLPASCAGVKYMDLTSSSFLGFKLVLCYGKKFFTVVNQRFRGAYLSFAANPSVRSCDYYNVMQDYPLLYHEDKLKFFPTGCRRYVSSIVFRNVQFSSVSSGLRITAESNLALPQLCPIDDFQSFEEFFHKLPILIKSHVPLPDVPPKYPPYCNVECGTLEENYFYWADQVLYFPNRNHFKLALCCDISSNISDLSTSFTYYIEPSQSFVTFFDVLKIFLSNVGESIAELSLSMLNLFLERLFRYYVFEIFMLFIAMYLYFSDWLYALVVSALLWTLRIVIFNVICNIFIVRYE